MHIQIFDRDNERLQAIHQTIAKMAKNVSTSITIELVSAPETLADAGVFSTPTICIDGKVFASGYVPADTEINRWLSRIGLPSRGPHAYTCICGQCMPSLFPSIPEN